MKKFLMYFGVFGLLLLPAQGAFAWNIQSLNPLPYIGIGPNYSTFSLNPFTGFKNCKLFRHALSVGRHLSKNSALA